MSDLRRGWGGWVDGDSGGIINLRLLAVVIEFVSDGCCCCRSSSSSRMLGSVEFNGIRLLLNMMMMMVSLPLIWFEVVNSMMKGSRVVHCDCKWLV
jgi:hypothetical protein